jgi:exonuclease III
MNLRVKMSRQSGNPPPVEKEEVPQLLNHINMTEQQSHISFSMDHLMVREGGQTAQAEPTVQCPEAGSDKTKLPGGSSSVRREGPILSETNNNPPNNPQTPSRTIPQQGNGGQPARQPKNLTQEEIKMIRLKTERETLWKSLGKTQGVKISSFNMKGRRDERKKSKWAAITTVMRKQRLLVMAVQETHLNEEEADALTNKFPKIIVESNGTSTNSGGVAFVLNKDLLNDLKWTHTELIPGRMSRLQVVTGDDNGLDIINVYAPNNNTEKAEFYEEVYKILTDLDDLVEPILMGDFNFVENAIDRAPQHEDNKKVTESFTKIRKKLALYDGWREHSPLEKQYTFFQETPGSASRIDRIYIHEKLFTFAYNFGILSSLTLSDHDIVFVELLKKKLPFIGKGMSRINVATIERESFRKRAKTTMMTYQKEMERKNKNNITGIQKDWMELKERLKEIAISDSKTRSQNLKREKEQAEHYLERKMDQLATATLENRERLALEMNTMRQNMAKTSMKEVTRLQEIAKMRYKKLGERCTKYFFGLNKKKFEQQLILGLLDKDQKMTTVTREMTEIATEYHEKLQAAPEMTSERKEAIQEMVDITDKELTDNQKEMLEATTTQGEIEDAISLSSNGTTPGIDGIPYEFYKSWKSPETEEEEKTEPDVSKMLHLLYNDIEKRGLQTQQKTGEKKKERIHRRRNVLIV